MKDDGKAARPPGMHHAEQALAIVLVLLAAEVMSRTGVLPAEDFPPVSVVLMALLGDLQHAKIWAAMGASLSAWAVGMLAVLVIALPAGMLMGASRRVYASTTFTVEFFRSIPSVAALPLLIFVYGIGFKLTVMLIVLSAIWPLLLQTMYGMHDIDPVLEATGRVYGLGRGKRLRLVTLPSIAPYVATGLRLSATTALVMAIAVSLIVGGEGLGGLIGSAAQGGQVPLMYGRILVTGIIGLLLTACLRALEKRALHWHVSQRRSST
ncbi:MAG: transporter permease [Rhizobacter sp.]|nr:transporter permease [Rhizobacter sp.]